MMKVALTLALAATWATAPYASAQTTPADPGTPIFVRPPQQQTPQQAVQPPPELVPTIPQIIITPPVVLTPEPSAPQPPQPLTAAPVRDRFTVWGSLSGGRVSGVSVGASAPVGRVGAMNLGLRVSAGARAGLPAPTLDVDLLLSGNGRSLRAYGGPNIGTLPGYAWLVGGVVGLRSDLGSGPWGYFAETRAQVGYGAGGGAAVLFVPSVNLGVTYRF